MTREQGCAEFNISTTSIAVIDINGLAFAKVACEVPADFSYRRKAEISIGPPPQCARGRRGRLTVSGATTPPRNFLAEQRHSLAI